MSYKTKSSNGSLIDDSSETSVIAKLRRLKIEENLLINNINKINLKESYEEDIELPVFYSSEFKNYAAKLKNSFSEIKHMFGDIKTVTEENLNSIDIENMKRDVIKLDDKMRNFKKHLQFELTSAISQEEELAKQIDIEENEPKSTFKSKTRIKPFNNIIPSPVKVMIQSPFKCQEVQRFQEFMKNSPNRYGGWTQYHHNVFVQIWHKHFNSIEQNEFNHESELVGNRGQNEDFVKEILQKIPGSTYGDIVLHQNWYCKYLYLKNQQRHALDNWKMNRRRLTGSRYKPKTLNEHTTTSNLNKRKKNSNGAKLHTNIVNVEESFDNETGNAEEIANALCVLSLQEDGLSFDTEINCTTGDDLASALATKQKQRSFSDLIKPTKQWTNRCESTYENVKCYNNLETIKKLRVPEWRLTLQN